jgi:hypothetical protein
MKFSSEPFGGPGRQYQVNQQPGGTAMMTYIVRATFTDQGIKNAKDSPKRAEAFRQMAKTFGVTGPIAKLRSSSIDYLVGAG